MKLRRNAAYFALLSFAIAAPAPVLAGTSAEAKGGAGEKLICKNRPRTGTRFATKVCRTADQWDAISEDSRRNMKETVDRPQIKLCGPMVGCGG